MEIGVAVPDAGRTLDLVLDLANRIPLPGAIGVRYVRQSKAFLSLAKFSLTCTIEMPCAYSQQSEIFFRNLWNETDKKDIAYTFHWGQMNNLNAAKVREKWGDDGVDKWIHSRNILLPRKEQRKMFSNRFLELCGLQ